jgi:hypothetical protein
MSGRDYDAARQRLAEAAGQPGWMQEVTRIEALTVAINEFQARYVAREVDLAVQWAECVFVPALEESERPRRRWTD